MALLRQFIAAVVARMKTITTALKDLARVLPKAERDASGLGETGAKAAKDAGSLHITAANPSESEVKAAKYLVAKGHDVELRDPVGTRARGMTSDLVVDGERWDIYTPKTSNVDRIVSAAASKGSQVHGGGVIIDLSQSNVTPEQLANIQAPHSRDRRPRRHDRGDSLMSKIRCVCNTILTTSGEIPNPIEWKVMSDKKFDEFSGTVNAEDIYQACGSIFRCPTCGRLWAFWEDLGGEPQLYAPESPLD